MITSDRNKLVAAHVTEARKKALKQHARELTMRRKRFVSVNQLINEYIGRGLREDGVKEDK